MTEIPEFLLSGSACGDWVDRVLLAGPGGDPCLDLGARLDRATLGTLVDRRQQELAAAGLTAGGTAALRLPPSLGFITSLLAAWRLGGQVSLLDHRLTDAEVDRALERLAPQVLVSAERQAAVALRGYTDVEVVVTARPEGRPAATAHVLIQLSSGSTGPSKVIARTSDDLERELDCYARLPEFPKRGQRTVLLSSIVHVLGLVAGLLHGLHAGVELVLPERLTPSGILDAIEADDRPTTVIGVPFHARLLTGATSPPRLPQLVRMIVAGELLLPGLAQLFTERYGVQLGTMYGMTEIGVIATDLTGATHPALTPVHGMEPRIEAGELHLRMPESPYLGLTDQVRWSDGWLHTRDAATLDRGTGRITILGRRDSQISVGGLKVDLTEVEQTLCGLPGVGEGVVVFDAGAIEAYLVLSAGTTAGDISSRLSHELAAYKRPRHLRVLPALPRTTTGKILRDPTALRAAAVAAAAESVLDGTRTAAH